jgi:hypothetical protein
LTSAADDAIVVARGKNADQEPASWHGSCCRWWPTRRTRMNDQDLAATVKKIDLRLQRVEQILPTLATKKDLEPLATKKELEPLATKKELEPLATKKELEPLATKEELKVLATKEEIRALATKEELQQAVAKLATKEELREAVAKLATKEELREAVAKLATKEELREAVAKLATKEELREAVERLEAKIDEQARGFRDVVHEAVRQAWAEAQHWAKVELESMRDAMKVLAESAAAWVPAVERVDRESRARDDALDHRILALEARPAAPPAAPRRRRRS